mmetsp:Transcript_8906/g.13708  ORF Transcript_8906/g.13708 Transcript_8906/m.13708 type:complete len:289 (-) Transcript_8906:241-1107(-)
MTHGSHRFVSCHEALYQIHHLGIQSQILRCPPPGNDKSTVVLHLHRVKVPVEDKVVAGFLRVGLVSLKVVHSGWTFVPVLLPGADGVHLQSQGEQGLEGYHHLVVLHVVPTQHHHLFPLGPLHGCPQKRGELLDKLRVAGPGCSSDQGPVRVGQRDGVWGNPVRTHLGDGGLECGVGGAPLALQHPRRRQHQLTVAHRRHRLARREEVPHQGQHLFIEGEVLWGAAPRDNQAHIALTTPQLVEICIEGKVVAWLLGVGLGPLEVVDSCRAFVSSILSRANCINIITIC